MRRLVGLGLIRRDQPFGSSERSSKKTLYLLDDPFLAFWFRYVEPNRSHLELGGVAGVLGEIRKDFNLYRGEIWESLVRQAIVQLAIDGMEWKPGKRWWGAGTDRKPLEVDVIAESADSDSLLVGEVKTTAASAEVRRAEFELKQKAEKLPFVQYYSRLMTRVFVADPRGRPSKNLVSGKDVFSALR